MYTSTSTSPSSSTSCSIRIRIHVNTHIHTDLKDFVEDDDDDDHDQMDHLSGQINNFTTSTANKLSSIVSIHFYHWTFSFSDSNLLLSVSRVKLMTGGNCFLFTPTSISSPSLCINSAQQFIFDWITKRCHRNGQVFQTQRPNLGSSRCIV